MHFLTLFLLISPHPHCICFSWVPSVPFLLLFFLPVPLNGRVHICAEQHCLRFLDSWVAPSRIASHSFVYIKTNLLLVTLFGLIFFFRLFLFVGVSVRGLYVASLRSLRSTSPFIATALIIISFLSSWSVVVLTFISLTIIVLISVPTLSLLSFWPRFCLSPIAFPSDRAIILVFGSLIIPIIVFSSVSFFFPSVISIISPLGFSPFGPQEPVCKLVGIFDVFCLEASIEASTGFIIFCSKSG